MNCVQTADSRADDADCVSFVVKICCVHNFTIKVQRSVACIEAISSLHSEMDATSKDLS